MYLRSPFRIAEDVGKLLIPEVENETDDDAVFVPFTGGDSQPDANSQV
jgi:hypothetical protein